LSLQIIHGDITKFSVDAIVNAANSALQQGGGVCGAIFAAAGARELAAACNQIGHCAVGEAVATSGFRLPAKHIFHTVGPVWRGGESGEEEQLRACYRNCLKLAESMQLKSVAFPLISSGIFGYPKQQAFSVAVSEIGRYLFHAEIDVFLVIYPTKPVEAKDARFHLLNEYLRSSDSGQTGSAICCSAEPRCGAAAPAPAQKEAVLDPLRQFSSSLIRALEQKEETFSQRLLRYIRERNLLEPEVYRHANLDRRLFSKIRGNPSYQPSKSTALALAVALHLNLEETDDLLRRAGYALSPSSRFDLIVVYYIKKGMFDIFEINETLYAFDESQLGA
jgi:O-acetyl-ADP-ribose deacetylase (regulator of RNase III)